MIRYCGGNDPNLIGRDNRPGCDCGLRFDDADRLVIWPHSPLPTLAEKRRAIEALAQVVEVPRAWLQDSGP